MLVLTRHLGERIMIGDSIVIEVVAVRGDAVRIGVTAPADIRVDREEIRERVDREGREREDFHS